MDTLMFVCRVRMRHQQLLVLQSAWNSGCELSAPHIDGIFLEHKDNY